MFSVIVHFDLDLLLRPVKILELTRTDQKAASDWLLVNDQILTIIYDNVRFSEISNKIELLRDKGKLEKV